jgi:hypothetical protein
MLADNRSQIIGVSVQGTIVSPVYPSLPAPPYVINGQGEAMLLPSQGGIVYNVRVGDSAFGWVADMVQPGVSISEASDSARQALNILACIGNEAVVMSGRAAGSRGTVTGKSGRFAEHVIIDFEPEVLDKLALGDKILIRALGRGLSLSEFPNVQIKSTSPQLLDAMEITAAGPGTLCVPVAAEVPATLIGAGSGLLSESGTVQIQSDHAESLERYGVAQLRLGDVVGVRDYDTRWGPGYRKGAATIGVVSHGDSPKAGHGPGVTPLLTAIEGGIQTSQVKERNIAELLGVRKR